MDRIFIEQAKNIRREYVKNAKEVVKCEGKIEEYKKELDVLQESLTENMDEHVLRGKFILVEKNIKAIEKIIQPHIDKIKSLEKDADKLFDNIKDRHKSITIEQIQDELIPHLNEIKF